MGEITVLQVLSAAVLGVLAWIVTSYIRLRRETRAGKKEDFDLFASMRAVSLDQIETVRSEINDLRERVAKAEDRAAKAERIADKLRFDLDAMIRHVIYLESIMRAQGIAVPPRPFATEDEHG